MPSVITLTGPSGSGKSSALVYLLSRTVPGFDPILIPKYTTRAPRSDDRGESICVDVIPPECDLVYEQYGARYGVNSQMLFDRLAVGKSPILIVNDVRLVEDLRNTFGKLVRSIFIFRKGPTIDQYQKLAASRNVSDERDYQNRFNKAQAIYRIYIENIHLFDHVILNSGNRRTLKTQALKIVKGLGQIPNWPLYERES